MAYRRFRLSENAVGPATLANPATLRARNRPNRSKISNCSRRAERRKGCLCAARKSGGLASLFR